jgi:RinA family phage transcriptional activator
MTTQEKVLRKGVFHHVEAELFAYPYRKREIARLREEILTPYDEEVNEPGVVKGKNSVRMPGDPTGRMAVGLASSAKLLNLERVADAIDESYNKLPQQIQELIKLKYWTTPQRYSTLGLCDKVGISESTYRRWRRVFIQNIADILGW